MVSFSVRNLGIVAVFSLMAAVHLRDTNAARSRPVTSQPQNEFATINEKDSSEHRVVVKYCVS